MTSLLARLAATLETSALTTHPGVIDELLITNTAQRWTVSAYEYHRGGDHAVILVARICDERTAAPDRVLRLAADMGAGALALIGNHYVVRFSIPAAQIETSPVEFIATYIHDVARAVGVELASNRADISGLEHLAH